MIVRLKSRQAADEAHQKFVHEDSDFLTYLNLWDAWHENKKKLSNSQLRKWCRQNFLSWMRMREWIDVHRQLRDLLKESNDKQLNAAARLHPVKDRRNDFASIHRALMTGLLANLAWKTADGEYTGAGGHKLTIWPGSALFRKGPKWFVAAELVETSQRYARTIARVQPEWIEPLAEHLVKREHSEPHWDANSGNVMAFEKVSLWGLPIVPRRRVPYSRVQPEKCRELFIQHGLVECGLLYQDKDHADRSGYEDEERQLISGSRLRVTPGRNIKKPDAKSGQQSVAKTPWAKDFVFLENNVKVLEQVEEFQARTRRHDLIPTDEEQFDWYDERIPADICDRNRFKRWLRKAERNQPEILDFHLDQFTDENQRQHDQNMYPSKLVTPSMTLSIDYQLDPGTNADGATISVPVEGLPQLSEQRLSWLVPGMVEQKVLALIRSLPKQKRRHFVPAPDTAHEVSQKLAFGSGHLVHVVADHLSKLAGESIRPEDFDVSSLPEHLRFNIRVLDHQKKVLTEGRSLEEVGKSLKTQQPKNQQPMSVSPEEERWQKMGFKAWEFGDIPESIEIVRAGVTLKAFPAIRDDGESVGLCLQTTAADAQSILRKGLRRLFLIADRKRVRQQIDNLPGIDKLRIQASSIKGLNLSEQLQLLMVERAWLSSKQLPRSLASFDQSRESGRKLLGTVAQELTQLIPQIFDQYHQTRRMLEDSNGPGWDDVLRDIKRQIKRLIHSGFLAETSWPWLIQYPRYFQAIRMRLQRLKSGGLKTERDLLAQFQSFQQRYEDRLSSQGDAATTDAMMVHYRWMLEEYRVSLFAQKLGTAITVSARKLDEHWARVS